MMKDTPRILLTICALTCWPVFTNAASSLNPNGSDSQESASALQRATEASGLEAAPHELKSFTEKSEQDDCEGRSSSGEPATTVLNRIIRTRNSALDVQCPIPPAPNYPHEQEQHP